MSITRKHPRLAGLDEALHGRAALHAREFADLETDVLRRHVVLLEPRTDFLCERLVFERADRQVHREACGLGIPQGFAVLAEPLQQALEHERVERGAFAALGGFCEECGRHFIAACIARERASTS